MKWLLYKYWDYFPSINIKLLYRSNEFLHNKEFNKIYIKEVYERSTKSEKGFMHSRFDKHGLQNMLKN